jgi:hypothetical protein
MSMNLITLQRRAHNTQKAWKLRSETGSLICVEWGMPLFVCPRMMQTDDDANGVLLYQGMYNAGGEADMYRQADWPIATVAQETSVCQSQMRRS